MVRSPAWRALLTTNLVILLSSSTWAYTCRSYGEYCRRQRQDREQQEKAHEQSCLSELRDSQGQMIRAFRAFGQQRGVACRKADELCEDFRNKHPKGKDSYCTILPQ